MAANKIISIITATYNSAATVADSLASVAAQKYSAVEHIIIDGNSSDDTLAVVGRYKHVSKIVSEKDDGIYDAMNKGIRVASGEIIGILNSDDFYEHSFVLDKIAAAFSDPGIDVVYGDLQYVNASDVRKIVRTWRAGSFQPDSFLFGWMPPHPSFFVRKRVYDRVGLFNTSLKSSADYELILRILLKNKLKAAYLPEVLVKMRTGGVSNASFSNRIRANKEDRMAWKINGLKPYFFTLYLKPLRKLWQFVR